MVEAVIGFGFIAAMLLDYVAGNMTPSDQAAYICLSGGLFFAVLAVTGQLIHWLYESRTHFRKAK